ncbi:MAG: hypothetical protein ACFHWX_10055 [Bacteroidota bacterium]
MKIKFKPRTSHGNVWMFYAVIAFFLTVFIFLLPVSEEPMLWIVYAFLGFLFMIVFLQASALTYSYVVSDKGLEIKNYFWKVIPFDQIKVIRAIDEEKTSQLLETVRSKQAIASNDLDFLGSMNSMIQYGNMIQYCSFQIVNQDSKVGRKITKVRAIAKGAFVIVITEDDKLYLISPEDAEGLVSEVEKHLE